MKPLIVVATILVFLSACATLNLSVQKKAILKDLTIDWSYASNVDSEYIPNIDSVMIAVLYNYNSQNHSFKLHKKQTGEQDGLTINFSRGKFTGDGEIAASYLVSAIGLIAAPITMLSASDGKSILFFWYFAADRIKIQASLTPELAGNNGQSVSNFIQTGATFTNKAARMDRMCSGINDYVNNILLNLSGDNKK